MKFLAFICVLLFSSLGLAQDYQLVAFENDYYRDFTWDELVTKLGETRSLVPFYVCNSQHESDLFWKPLLENPATDSLQFKGDDDFLKAAKKALTKIESSPYGAKLLRLLERSHYPLTITEGTNSFVPKEVGGKNYYGIKMATAVSILLQKRTSDDIIPFHDIGVGGLIRWDPHFKEQPAHIALAHEMYHAFDSIRGLLDLREVRGEKYESTSVAEFRAVYFENLLRKDLGLPYRRYYSDAKGPGVLNEKGEPLFLPSPCLGP